MVRLLRRPPSLTHTFAAQPAALSRAGGMMDRPFVEIANVAMRYGGIEGTLALQGTTMNIAKGEFVAVVGPSGCGKSTLMRLVTGLWPATAGHVVVAGSEVAGPLSIAGMAFQNPTLLPWRNILDNVMLPLEVVEPHRRQLSRDRARYEKQAKDLLALVGLGGFEQKFPWQLSGGMQQRASLCRALIHEPALLMLDEPFAALDIFTREDLWAVLQDVWMVRRPTVILVTHDLREAAFLADRVLVMSSRPGRIIAERQVNLPRPRTLETTYSPEFVSLVHDLRENISAARKGEEVANA
jgi:NitT/TauT family transport system ATP-binding protein